MPTDTKRLPVPDDSRPPVAGDFPVVLLDAQGERCDKRAPGAVRPIFARVGVVSSARGSACFELGLTKVICAVYGPREVTRREDFSLQGQLLCVFKFATFSGRYRRQHQPDSEEKELSQIMREALEPAVILDKFPKARMDIFVTVLEDDGSALSAGLSAASLALAHAGVEMFDLVVGASLRHVEGVTLVNPSATEERYIPESKESTTDDSSLTIGYMPSLRQVSALVQGGLVDLVTNEKYINTCIEMCVRMYPVLQKCLADSLASKETKTNNAL